ncbi:hypothetical protein XFLAVUS301_32120 [Xanthobacter flavus]|uniref:Uncharacterized protein n=1 Tax=Xanthobacter flavus TaxID=281 RepID=A0A9W6FN21_XANFL|nr:hypothetical protein XFLAVUS301_32120 [Xanthobacter flavus]
MAQPQRDGAANAGDHAGDGKGSGRRQHIDGPAGLAQAQYVHKARRHNHITDPRGADEQERRYGTEGTHAKTRGVERPAS